MNLAAASSPEPESSSTAINEHKAAEARGVSPWRTVFSLVIVAICLRFLPAYVAPQWAVDSANSANTALSHLDSYQRDPWGNHWAFKYVGQPAIPGDTSYFALHRRYSTGPNGKDEAGGGDDRFVGQLSGASVVALTGLWFLPYGLAIWAWILVLRIARRVQDRVLGWAELRWALLTGGPAAALALSYTWWGSDNSIWRDLLQGQSGSLLGWRASLVGAVVTAFFVAGWALSRPPKRAEDHEPELEARPPGPAQGPTGGAGNP